LHAASKLALAQIAALAKITDRTRHLKAVIFGYGFFRLSRELRNEPFRFFDFKRFVAAPA
jgi:excinuclease UvrABC helicase subunit UvrB